MAIEAAEAGHTNQNQPFFLHPNFYYSNVFSSETTFIPSPPLFQPTPTDSGLTFIPTTTAFPSSGKRSRDYYSNYSLPDNYNDSPSALSQRPLRLSSPFQVEASVQIHHQQSDLDCLIAHHMQRLRVELEERAKQRSKVLVSAVREAVAARLREKEEEIERAAKLNLALQEGIRRLCMENQLWRGIAQTSEAAANSLRSDLERVLTDPGLVEGRKPDDDNDAESCCGSRDGGKADDEEGVDGVVGEWTVRCKGGCGGEREAGVVVMPCRHLCLCTTCGSSSRSCPVCGSAITASIHVNFSSS